MWYHSGALVFPLDPDCSIVAEAAPKQRYSQDRVDAIWALAEKEGRRLVNGSVATLVAYSPKKLSLQFVEYKIVYAWMMDPEFRRSISLFPIGITGCSFCGDSVLIGERSSAVSTYAGFLETVPAGSIEKDRDMDSEGSIDVRGALLAELFEEAGISSSSVKSVSPLALIWSESDGIWDIVYSLRISNIALPPLRSSIGEHRALEWRDRHSVEEALKFEKNRYIPIMPALFLFLTTGKNSFI